MRLYLSFFKMRFLTLIQYRTAALAGVATQFVFGMVYVLVMYAFYSTSDAPQPMDLSQVITYIWLGQALLGYGGFAEYGLNIIAAFDSDEDRLGTDKSGKPILALHQLEDFCKGHSVRIGIITVPAANAQAVCDRLIAGGIEAIWNFAPKHLDVPEHILVQTENMAASLALLSKHLTERLERQQSGAQDG